MKLKINVKKILIALFYLSILLLVSNLLISLIFSDNESISRPNLTDAEIDRKFVESLHSFAIKDEWISKLKTENSVTTYIVKIPNDLPIPQILNEVNKQYYNYNIRVSSEEKKINGRTQVNLLDDKIIRLSADLRYTSGIERKSSKSAIFVYGREDKQNEYDSLLNGTTRDVSALLVPSKSNSSYTKWLRENGFDYAVFLNNKVNDIEFKMEKYHSETRVKLIVQNLVVSFPNALFFVIDNNSDLYNSSNYETVKNEFNKRKINCFTSDSLNFILDETKASERLVKLVENYNKNQKMRIALPLNIYQLLTNDLMKLIRVGYKFVRNSDL